MNKLAIICADDDPAILSSLEMEIKSLVGNDYLIELAENGEDALEIYEELSEEGYEIVLFISDYLMPNMKGDELLRQIQQCSPKTLKIMLTGQADLKAVGNAIKSANLFRYIAKPWQPADFRLTLISALNSHRQDKKLANFYADLETKIEQRTQELQTKNQALIQLNQEKNEFLGIAAHDLKNPLSAIQGWAEMIIEDYDDIPKAEIIDVNRLILNSSRQMFELIKNLLDVNAIESGQINAELSCVDILPTVQTLVDSYSEQAKTKNLSLQLHQKNNPYYALVDKNALHQILDNLISNAIKYSPYTKHVNIRMRQFKKTVGCEIQDEGQGLSEDDQKKLFGKFIRLTPKPTGKEHSTGLGLFIVKKLVEAMNGNVWCESELGKGTSFFVEFPAFLS
jgi:two-component system sensor histidine kinase/response regulator